MTVRRSCHQPNFFKYLVPDTRTSAVSAHLPGIISSLEEKGTLVLVERIISPRIDTTFFHTPFNIQMSVGHRFFFVRVSTA
jgi:hypothetical protein